MLRTTVYFDEEIGLALRRLAAVHGKAQAELIREALAEYVTKAERELESRLPPGVSAYSSGRSDVSARTDALLKQAARRRR
jgi:predicted transcriptional regulator